MTRAAAFLGLAIAAFAQPGSHGLCPGSSESPEKSGILRPIEQIGKLIPPASAGARLTMIDLESEGVCQFWLVSGQQKLIFIDFQGSTRLASSVSAREANLKPLPVELVDLPEAIAAARQQGMLLPLNSAKLMMVQPRGKPAVAVWTLSPRRDPQGHVLSYFISATDAGHPLKLSDVTDYFNDYNAQWQHVIDVFHSATQQNQTNPAATGVIEGQPCVCLNPLGFVNFRGEWSDHLHIRNGLGESRLLCYQRSMLGGGRSCLEQK